MEQQILDEFQVNVGLFFEQVTARRISAANGDGEDSGALSHLHILGSIADVRTIFSRAGQLLDCFLQSFGVRLLIHDVLVADHRFEYWCQSELLDLANHAALGSARHYSKPKASRAKIENRLFRAFNQAWFLFTVMLEPQLVGALPSFLRQI